MEEFSDVAGAMKSNILMEYLNKSRCKVLANKKKTIAKISKRRDHQMVLSAEFKQEENIQKLVVSEIQGCANPDHKNKNKEA